MAVVWVSVSSAPPASSSVIGPSAHAGPKASMGAARSMASAISCWSPRATASAERMAWARQSPSRKRRQTPPPSTTRQAEARSSSQGPAWKCVTCAWRSASFAPTSARASAQAPRRCKSSPRRTRQRSKGLVRFTATMPSSPASAPASGRKRTDIGACNSLMASRRATIEASSSPSGRSLSGPWNSTVKRRPRRWKLRKSSPKCSKKRHMLSSSPMRK
mmetsp:Transcript_16778/g.48723  ORF Transcript_16778/g.48723 Transcript_16778/m.48723 type:complete len:218 (-) Transcript_16778:743-1396(-)